MKKVKPLGDVRRKTILRHIPVTPTNPDPGSGHTVKSIHYGKRAVAKVSKWSEHQIPPPRHGGEWARILAELERDADRPE